VVSLDTSDGGPALVHLIHQGTQTGRKIRCLDWQRTLSLDLQRDGETDGIAVLEALDDEYLRGIGDTCHLGIIEILKTEPIGLFIANHHLPFGLVLCLAPQCDLACRPLLDLHDLASEPARVVDARLAVLAQLYLRHSSRPEGAQTLDNDQAEKIHHHGETERQAHSSEPDKGLTGRVPYAPYQPRWTLHLCAPHYTVR